MAINKMIPTLTVLVPIKFIAIFFSLWVFIKIYRHIRCGDMLFLALPSLLVLLILLRVSQGLFWFYKLVRGEEDFVGLHDNCASNIYI